MSTQGCNNLVISRMSQTCQNNLATSKSDNFDKVVTSCQQVVPNLLTTCDKQCEYILLTACEQTCNKLVVFTCVDAFATGLWQACQQVVTMLLFYQVATRLSLTTC